MLSFQVVRCVRLPASGVRWLVMSNKERPEARRRRRLFLGNLAKVARPPFTTPQWKDAIREDEARGKKEKGDRPA